MSEFSSNTEMPMEKHRPGGDTLRRLMWASFLVMVGLILLANSAGILPTFRGAEPIHWIMVGGGALLLLDAFIRAISPDFANPDTGHWFLGTILLVVGASAVFGVSGALIWPAALILLGVGMLARSIRGR